MRVPSTVVRALASSRPRGANYLTYLSRGLAQALARAAPDVVLCMTDPPMVGDIALAVARRFRAPLVVISEDVFPEIALELKRLENPVADRPAPARSSAST